MQDDPFQNWSYKNGRLLKTSVTQGKFSPVSMVEVYDNARNEVDTDFYMEAKDAIPLFEANSPTPTQEYVIYDHETQEVKIYDPQSRSIKWLSPQQVATTRLGQRLRWYLPEARQDLETLENKDEPPEVTAAIDSLSENETSEFFTEMRELVKDERQTDKANNRSRYMELGLEAAIDQEMMSGPFIPIGAAPYEDDRAYKFQLAGDDDAERNLRDDTNIFPDTQYIAGVRGHDDQNPIEMESVHVGDTELWLRPLSGKVIIGSAEYDALTDTETTVWLHDLLNPLPYNRRLSAISKLERQREKRRLLSGNRAASFVSNNHVVPDMKIKLNDSQEKALVWAQAANDCLCIHGPPGTGKTRTLTAYVRDAVDRDKRVLITAHSNQAVDNLLVGDSTVHEPEDETLHALAQREDVDLSVARSGANSESKVVRRYYQGVSTKDARVVAATTNGAARFSPGNFDVAVVDEATQASRAATAIAYNVSEKLILAGDHKQLPPFAASDERFGDEKRSSLFETLMNRYGENIAVMLRTQYRMNQSIATFPNSVFYDGELKTADPNQNWTIDDLSPLMGIHIKGTEQQAANHSYRNPEEAEAAAKQVKLLTNNNLSPSNIGVITAYRGQINQVKTQISKLNVENIHQVEVNTIDAFQGSERDAIIISLVRSNSDSSSGFLTVPDEGPRRLNVALTRGRKRLVVIADWDTLSEYSRYRDQNESCAELYAKLESRIRDDGMMLEIESQSAE